MHTLFRSGSLLFCAVFLLFLSLFASGCKPRCPIPSCEVRMVHRHGKGEFRGSKWYKKQNPRIGEKLPKPTKEGTKPHNGKSQMRK